MQTMLAEEQDMINTLCDIAESSPYLFFVGSGTSYCTVSQAELVMLEVDRIVASRCTAGQFMHGPIELVGPGFCGVLFDFDPVSRPDLEAVVTEILANGGKAVLFTNRETSVRHERLTTYRIPCHNSFISPILEIIPIIQMVYTIGIRRHLTPGVLQHVSK
jgi:glucosamine--fructose-6-phosphate aminotransferase (isomerizing)